MKSGKSWIAGVLSLAILQGCSPAPRHLLTSEEKKADLYWMYSIFDENYAPLELKEKLYGFDYDKLKTDYLNQADTTQSNEEFYQLLYRFVAEFRDAHTSGSMTNSSLPGRAETAYLGFTGRRNGNNLEVTAVLPTLKNDLGYPVKIGDLIEKLDGTALPDIVKNEMVHYRNLGNDQSNLTYHLNKIFNRVSTSAALPTATQATLTVFGVDKKERTVVLPWVVKDIVAFTTDEKAAADKQAAQQPVPMPSPSAGVPETRDQLIFGLGAMAFAANTVDFLPSMIRKITPGTKDYNVWNTFTFIDTMPSWDSPVVGKAARDLAIKMGMDPTLFAAADPAPLAQFKTLRKIPDNVIWIDDAKAFPTYMKLEKVLDAAGKQTGSRFVAYMYLYTFEPDEDDATVLAEVTNTLKTLQLNGVGDLVIDLVDNGGGELGLGMLLAQLLSYDKLTQPGMQFRLSDTWLDQFQTTLLDPTASDSAREYAQRIYTEMKADQPNQRLSPVWSAEYLNAYPFNKVTPLTTPMNIVLMTNEMCASMCDIFTSIMKDNGVAKTVGAKTMGAGGNVVQHGEAPNSHFLVNQTESLIVRKDGSYIENNGVDPDVKMAVNEDVANKYDNVRLRAVKMLVAPDAPDVVVTPAPPKPPGS